MTDNLKRLVKALKSTGLDVEVCEDWDEEYCLMTISNPNQDDDYHQLCFNKRTGRYASYVNGSYFVHAQTKVDFSLLSCRHADLIVL